VNILVAYDVNTQTKDGRRRLRKIAQVCLNHGQRVQLSVFECTVADLQFEAMRAQLLKVIDPGEDNLRIYRLRGKREDVVESYGRDYYVDYTEPLIV
jgi:CRISPR-associated protein Cas2